MSKLTKIVQHIHCVSPQVKTVEIATYFGAQLPVVCFQREANPSLWSENKVLRETKLIFNSIKPVYEVGNGPKKTKAVIMNIYSKVWLKSLHICTTQNDIWLSFHTMGSKFIHNTYTINIVIQRK